MSSKAGFVGELNAPESAGRMKDFDAYIKEPIGVTFADADDAKFAGFLGKAVEDLDPGAQGQRKGYAKQGSAAADGNGFRRSVERLVRG